MSCDTANDGVERSQKRRFRSAVQQKCVFHRAGIFNDLLSWQVGDRSCLRIRRLPYLPARDLPTALETLGGASALRIPKIGEGVLAMLGAAVVELTMPLADVAP